MKIHEIGAIFIICLFGFIILMFLAKLFHSLIIALLIFILGISMLNYLNHGKFRPWLPKRKR